MDAAEEVKRSAATPHIPSKRNIFARDAQINALCHDSVLKGERISMAHLPTADLAVLLVYLLVTTGFGCWFFQRTRNADRFMEAGRSLPGWAVGLSLFGSYVSSISFLANPGIAYGGNWVHLVFSLMMPVGSIVAVLFYIPFFRSGHAVSAYAHLEDRFGLWARTYTVICFLLLQSARFAIILFLLSKALQPLVGAPMVPLIVVLGFLITIYPFLGGTESVIWTGVVQGIVLLLGPLACVAVLFWKMPGGPQAIVSIAAAEDKFSLGSPWDFSLTHVTFLQIACYGIVSHLQNLGVDQGYVQRYLSAESDAAAKRSIWVGTALFLPIATLFFFIGTCLYSFYTARPELLPAGISPDDVFPHFIRTELPLGLRGLVLAALCAAAMDSNLNSMATLYLCDIHHRLLHPRWQNEQRDLLTLRLAVLGFGAASTLVAVLLAVSDVKQALNVWWDIAGIVSGGILGLFLLGWLVPRCSSRSAAVSVFAGVLLTLWLTIGHHLPAPLYVAIDKKWILVFATVGILGVGYFLALLNPRRPRPKAE